MLAEGLLLMIAGLLWWANPDAFRKLERTRDSKLPASVQLKRLEAMARDRIWIRRLALALAGTGAAMALASWLG